LPTIVDVADRKATIFLELEERFPKDLCIQSSMLLNGEDQQVSSTGKLVPFMKKQIEIENQIVDSLNNALIEIQNPSVRGVLKGISLDSVKHAELYASAIKLLTSTPQALKQEHLDKQRKLVEKHIAMEAELIEKLNKTVPTVENSKVKLLLEAILSDEKRHHELLKTVLEIIVQGETITENDWWDILWKNVPFHGAPGG
jgi:rubrerythrin